VSIVLISLCLCVIISAIMHLVGSGISPAEQSCTEVIQQSSSQCFSNSRKELEIEKVSYIFHWSVFTGRFCVSIVVI